MQATNAALMAERNQAMQKVREIVNQPVIPLPRTRGMHVASFGPAWFHAGATKPNFNAVDVRATQGFHYDKFDYVTSDLNPGVVFIGRQLEFNPMTKYFYTDRSLPKKKLSEAEMLEINRLYRVIGRCEQEMLELKHPESGKSETEPEPARQPIPRSNYVRAGLGVLLVLALYAVYRKWCR